MQAVLMAGGKGTRLHPFTAILPKPLVPIGEISILEMVLCQLKYFGFRKIIIAVGHKAEIIMAVIGDGGRFGLDIVYHYEVEPLGTMGALAYLDGLEDNFLVMNGDICTNMDFGRFYNDHVRRGAMATIGTYARCEKMGLGVLTVDETDQKIVGFKEKPTYDLLVSMGVNALSKSIVDLVPKGEFFGFDDLMHKMLKEEMDVRSCRFDGLWHDIGLPDDYERMLRDFEGDPAAFLPEGA
jgi:NDP-sugar pyrophosphorylase family protein